MSLAIELTRLKEESKTASMLTRCKTNAETIMKKRSEILSRLKEAKNEFLNGDESVKEKAEEKRKKAMEEFEIQNERFVQLKKICDKYSSASSQSSGGRKSIRRKSIRKKSIRRKSIRRKTKSRVHTRSRY